MRTTSHDPVAARHEGEYMAMRLTGKRALVAVAAGLALAGAPAFALTAAPAPAVAAEQAEGVTVPVTGGQGQFTDAINRSHASTIELTGKGDDGNGMFNFWKNIFGSWSQNGTHAETVNIDHDITIVNNTGNPNAYLSGVQFNVQPGAKLTLVNVNIADVRNIGSTNETVKPVTVQPGGEFVTQGKGDIVADNGKDEGYAINLLGSEDPKTPAKATLGAAPSGFLQNIDINVNNETNGYLNSLEGNYGGTYCVTANKNSQLTITDGAFTVENGQYQSIQSRGTVTIKPAENSYLANGGTLGTVLLNDANAKLVANDTLFAYQDFTGEDAGDIAVKATLQLDAAGAKAYLTDSTVWPSSKDDKIKAKPAVYLADGTTLYEQDTETDGPVQTYSTGNDYPSFSEFKSVYEGDHLTTNQYKAQVTLADQVNAVAEDVKNPNQARGLWKLADNAKPSDLESLVNAERTKLTDGAQESATDGGSVVSANLGLGKSQVYGEYEVAKNNETTSIEGEGHAYAFSQVHELQAGWDVSSYRSGATYTAPKSGDKNANVDETVPDGLVFAGWYTQGGDLTTGNPAKPVATASLAEDAALGTQTKNGYAYAKFVPAGALDVRVEERPGKDSADTDANGARTRSVRLVGAIDGYNYGYTDAQGAYNTAFGFEVSLNGEQAKTFNTNTAWNSINETINGKKQNQTPAQVFPGVAQANKVFTVNVSGIKVPADKSGNITVTPILRTKDGTVVRGATKTVKFSEVYTD